MIGLDAGSTAVCSGGRISAIPELDVVMSGRACFRSSPRRLVHQQRFQHGFQFSRVADPEQVPVDEFAGQHLCPRTAKGDLFGMTGPFEHLAQNRQVFRAYGIE
ncbi:hypothetical protein GV67_10735 [Pseudorhizobium pelagicum]|uniref:Uncharacterized protein n=1 Tax=Pseudorhizobium pelagicum TaxID=1509405 RepID=A0A922T6T6_9HYPH|nr:hypothetical protein GV68_20375 [Pseudorhizobium pelagicum]KEQ04162.1 hypothetical protein GV67_10735 [Pseudorhizobium pelagicum]